MEMHSEPFYKGFRTSDPQKCDGSKYWDVTTWFYAFSDIPKALKLYTYLYVWHYKY